MRDSADVRDEWYLSEMRHRKLPIAIANLETQQFNKVNGRTARNRDVAWNEAFLSQGIGPEELRLLDEA